jgi:hypothetical protein
MTTRAPSVAAENELIAYVSKVCRFDRVNGAAHWQRFELEIVSILEQIEADMLTTIEPYKQLTSVGSFV